MGVLGTLFRDEDFADLFPRRGQRAAAPWRLALITVMQFAENLTDRQAADAVRARIDWKCALGLELDDPGFDFSVLSEFRGRLLVGGVEDRLLDQMLKHFQEKELLKAKGRQRTDSTHIIGAVRNLNRLEIVGETLHCTLNVLAQLSPEEWQTITIRHDGQRIEASMNGERLIEVTDDTFSEAGGVGVWTKADAATSFDDLSVSPAQN